MASLEEIRQERIKKIERLEEAGMEAYPASARRDKEIDEILSEFTKISRRKRPFSLTGRVTLMRRQGGLIFVRLDDGTGVLQAALERNKVGKELFSLFRETVDIGDFLELRGSLGKTKRGEKTLFVVKWKMIVKSIRPLPEKWHGLRDAEERLRRRYLDLLSQEETRERFRMRTMLVKEIRSFLDKEGFEEVETPVLQPLYGGASAQPFMTHHNALDVDLYLRISDELYLKRLLVGGYGKVYELAKNFRNEGIDAMHYPEFTMLEWYEAYSDVAVQRARVEKLLKTLVRRLHKKTYLSVGDNQVSFSGKFKVLSYEELLRRYALLTEPFETSREELALKASQIGVPVGKGESSAMLLDKIAKKVCRPKIIQPTFIVDYPIDTLPLAKRKACKGNFADAFQLIVGGIELVKAFSELNDPLEQRKRFEREEHFRAEGEEEAQRLDEDFLQALEYGMPPAGGVGIGIDRLAMLLTDIPNIKELILFPSMRPKE